MNETQMMNKQEQIRELIKAHCCFGWIEVSPVSPHPDCHACHTPVPTGRRMVQVGGINDDGELYGEDANCNWQWYVDPDDLTPSMDALHFKGSAPEGEEYEKYISQTKDVYRRLGLGDTVEQFEINQALAELEWKAKEEERKKAPLSFGGIVDEDLPF
jgi:hypothetical protein